MNRARACISSSGSAVFIGFTIASVGGQQPPACRQRVYTRRRRRPAKAAYAQQCAGCHGADFRGGGDAPPVAGVDFRAKWGPRAVNELFTYSCRRCRRPVRVCWAKQGTLNVTAYLLQINGATAGSRR